MAESLPPRAQTADGTLGKSKSQVNVRFLRTMDAFNKTHKESPSWVMAEKLPSGDTRGKVHTEPGPDVSQKLDCCRSANPKWSMQPRWKGEQPKGAWVPAPGAYDNPGTMNKKHPTLETSGRGWTWGSQERNAFGKAPRTPSPDRYRDGRKDVAMHKEPAWTMSGRPDNTGMKLKGELHSSTAYSEPKTLRNCSGMIRKGGKAKAPEWQFLNRPASTLIPSKDIGLNPGPGAHTPLFGGVGAVHNPYSKIKRSPSYGFGSSSRFEKPRDTAHVL